MAYCIISLFVVLSSHMFFMYIKNNDKSKLKN